MALGGQMPGSSCIGKVLVGSYSDSVRSAGRHAELQLPSPGTPASLSQPHTTSGPYFPPCFSFLRVVKRCSLPVIVPPPFPLPAGQNHHPGTAQRISEGIPLKAMPGKLRGSVNRRV